VKIALTGATGFVGRNLLPQLAEHHEVVALTRGAPPAGLTELADWITVDLSRPIDRSRLPEHVDAVIHLAQSQRYRDFPEGAGDVFTVNIQSTFQLLEFARAAGASRFLFASSGGVCGHERLTETSPISPINFYLSSKHAGELLVRSYAQLFTTVIFRFFFVYGPGQTGMLVPTLAGRVVRGEQIVIEGDPGLRINPIYIADAVRTVEPALTVTPGGLFNIAGDEVVTMTALVHTIASAAGIKPSITHVESDGADELVGDNSRMVESLGVTPTFDLSVGLTRVMEALPAANRGLAARGDPPI
jgi:UDP-glucose 4-epimerase